MNKEHDDKHENIVPIEIETDRPVNNNIRYSTKLTKSSKRWMAFWTFLILCCLLAGIGGGIMLYVGNALSPVVSSEKEMRFTVPKGVSSGRIANILEENGLVRNGTVFHYYLKYKKEGSRFQAGEYAMSPGITVDRIIEMFNNGDTVEPETFHFIVTEGQNIIQIADILSEMGHANREQFMEMATNPSKIIPPEGTVIPPFVQQIPENEGMKYRLEGYLFPETYEMRSESTTQDVLLRLLQELSKKLDTLPEGWEEQLTRNGVTLHEMMTIASLVEREVVVNEERPLVAGIIYHRLKIGMKLDIDATVQYALDKHKERLFEKDLKTESPYNTYLIKGLPPGPIASPSIASIRAALYPEETKYLYYVTKKDGSNGHLFAETLKKHQQNIAQSNRTAKESN